MNKYIVKQFILDVIKDIKPKEDLIEIIPNTKWVLRKESKNR
jgi:hypothetical protein